MDTQARLEAALGDRYRISALLGEGGMATVYRAEDLKHRRPVALKVLRPELSSSEGTERFRREIAVAASLNHPNILALHDSGEAEGLRWFVMPLVEGESLRERIARQGRIPVEDAIGIVGEVADALDYAHSRGLVHRDIKPENVLFQASHALVTDFGIAQVTTAVDHRLTATGHFVGTLAYMSPEQFDESVAVDGRADVYALGCVFSEMVTGSPPFDGKTASTVLARKLTGTHEDLSDVGVEAPATLDGVLRRALSIDPADRFETAGAFARALRHANSRAALEAEEARQRRRSRVRTGLAAVGIVVLGLVGWGLDLALAPPAFERIAVMPFSSGSGGGDQQPLVRGIYDDLTKELARFIRVPSMSSVLPLVEEGRSPGDVASVLDADGWLEGEAVLGADEVRVELSLVDRETGDLLWSETFTAHPRNLVALYHRAIREIAEQSGVRLSPDQLSRLAESPEVDPEVQSALFRARYAWQSLDAESLDLAEEYYGLALARSDSTSAEAWFGLGQVWGLRAQMGFVSGAEASVMSTPFFARAQALDPDLHGLQAQAALTGWAAWDWDASLAAFERALASDPTDALTRSYHSHALLLVGRDEEAREEAERARADDPLDELVMSVHGQFQNFIGEYEAAEQVFTRILERSPGSPVAISNLRTTYHLLGRFDESIEVWRTFYRGEQGDTAAARIFDEGLEEGGYRTALAAVADAYAERNEPRLFWQIATLYTRAGNRAGALDYLERALEEARDPNLPYILVDPIFDDLRGEPRFQALVPRLNLSSPRG